MSYPQHEPHKPFSPEIEEGYPAEPEKKLRGCFFYGCLTLILLLLLTVVSLGIIGYYFYGKFNELVNTYTLTTSEPIPKVDYSEAQRKELHDRWDAFKKSVEAGKASEIVLTSDDVNSLLEDNPELRGVAYVTIKDGEVSGKISLPLDRFVIFGKGRFLNGNVVVTPKLENGFLDVRLKSGECNGKKMSEDGVKAAFPAEPRRKLHERREDCARPCVSLKAWRSRATRSSSSRRPSPVPARRRKTRPRRPTKKRRKNPRTPPTRNQQTLPPRSPHLPTPPRNNRPLPRRVSPRQLDRNSLQRDDRSGAGRLRSSTRMKATTSCIEVGIDERIGQTADVQPTLECNRRRAVGVVVLDRDRPAARRLSKCTITDIWIGSEC